MSDPIPFEPAGVSRRRASRALLLTYCVFVAFTTLLPFRFSFDRTVLAGHFDRISWHPLRTAYGRAAPASDLVGNVVFFVPLGVLAYLAQRRRRGSDPARILRATGLGFALSLGVETLQSFTPGRNPATSDLLSNTLGAFFGAVGIAAGWRVNRSGWALRAAVRLRTRRDGIPTLGLMFVVILQGLLPFDPSWRSAAASLEALRHDPWIGAGADNLHAAPVYALLAGVLAFTTMHQSRSRRLAGVAILLIAALLCSGALESTQLLLRSRTTALLDVVAALLGTSVGVLFAGLGWHTANRQRRSALVTLAYTLGLACVTLLDVRPWITVSRWLGMSAPRLEPTLMTVNGSLLHLLLYVPLGHLLTRSRPQAHAASWQLGTCVAAGCAAVALALEAMRLAILGGADGWRLVTASLGGLVGAFACAWSEAATRAGARQRKGALLSAAPSS